MSDLIISRLGAGAAAGKVATTIDDPDFPGEFVASWEDAASGSAHVIEDEGTPLTQRANLSFEGAGVTVTDDGVDTTTVTIPGASSGILRGVLPFQSGRWYEPQVSTDYSTGVFIASGLALYVPLWLVADATLDRIAVNVTTAIAGSTVNLGLYADDGTGKPGARIADCGSVSTATTGAKTLTISQAVPAGLVWLVALALGGAPGVSAHSVTDADSYPNGFTAAFDATGALGWNESGLAALPATATPSAYGNNRPRIQVRAA